MPALNLPTHHFTGLRAIGVLPSGRIIWPVLGGNGEGDGGAGGAGSGSGGSGGAGNGGGQGQGEGGKNDDGKSSDKTFTQADLERIVGERLTRERSKYGDYDALKAQADELTKLKDAQASDAEKASKQAAKDAETKVRSELEPRMTRLEVAIAKGLPEELAGRVLSAAKRLVGTTREELEADATEFFTTSPINAGQQQQGGGFDQGTRGGGGSGKPTVASGADMYAQRHGKKT